MLRARTRCENGRGDRYVFDPEGQLKVAYYEALTPDATVTDTQRLDSFGYDALGNRQGVNTQAGRGAVSYSRRDNGVNQYLNWSLSPALTYDDEWYGTPGNGVLMEEGWIKASYNALNQPITIDSPDLGTQQIWFGYDPSGVA